MKKLTALFGFGVVGIVFCLVMTIVTGIQQNRQKNEEKNAPITIPTPALPSS